MTVRKIKGEWYVDTYVRRPGKSPQRLRRRAPVQTKRDAEAYERSLLQDVYGLSDRPPRTFEDFVLSDFAAYVKAHNRASESESKESILRLHLLPAFGAKPLNEITLRDIEAYALLKSSPPKGKGLAPKSINNHLTVLHKCLSLAHEYGDLATVPTVKWRKVPQQRFRFLTFEEVDALIAAADPGMWRAMITLACRTGLRRGELFALRWSDIDLVTGKIVVSRSSVRDREGPTKSGRIRTVPLTSQAAEAIRSIRGTVDLVFHVNGQPIGRNLSKAPMIRACRKAKIAPLQWHALRHTFASHLAMGGVPMRSIMELLGHTTMQMTLRYAHLAPDSLTDAVAALERQQLGNRRNQYTGKASNNDELRLRCRRFDSRRLHRYS